MVGSAHWRPGDHLELLLLIDFYLTGIVPYYIPDNFFWTIRRDGCRHGGYDARTGYDARGAMMPGGRHDARRAMTPRAMTPGAHILDRARRPQFGSGNGLVLEHECCACVNDHSSAHLALEPAWGGVRLARSGTFRGWYFPGACMRMLGCRADVGSSRFGRKPFRGLPVLPVK